MSVEAPGTINTLDSSLPTSADLISEGDNHIRLIKGDLKLTFPGITGAVTATHVELNYSAGLTSAIQGQLNAITGSLANYALLNSPTFTGTPRAPTPAFGSSGTEIATMAALVAQAFVTTLPGQAGNSGKFLTTDGGSASWAFVPAAPFSDATALVKAAADATKQVKIDASGVTAGTVRTLSAPDKNGVIATLADQGMVLLATATVNNVAAASFALAGYDSYVVDVQNLAPVTTSQIQIRTSSNNGVSYDSGATDYRYVGSQAQSSTGTPSSFNAASGQSQIPLSSLSVAAAGSGVSGRILVESPNSSVASKHMTWSLCLDGGNIAYAYGAGSRDSASAITNIQLFSPSGNLASGMVKVYGLRKTL